MSWSCHQVCSFEQVWICLAGYNQIILHHLCIQVLYFCAQELVIFSYSWFYFLSNHICVTRGAYMRDRVHTSARRCVSWHQTNRHTSQLPCHPIPLTPIYATPPLRQRTCPFLLPFIPLSFSPLPTIALSRFPPSLTPPLVTYLTPTPSYMKYLKASHGRPSHQSWSSQLQIYCSQDIVQLHKEVLIKTKIFVQP